MIVDLNSVIQVVTIFVIPNWSSKYTSNVSSKEPQKRSMFGGLGKIFGCFDHSPLLHDNNHYLSMMSIIVMTIPLLLLWMILDGLIIWNDQSIDNLCHGVC